MQCKDGPFFPHIRLLHKYPFLLPKCQVDKGAIPYVIGGANVMCPGLTSPGGKVPEGKADSIVAIYCEGKEHALAVGTLTMSGAEMYIYNYTRKKVNKGIGIELLVYIGDEAWNIK